MGAGVSEVVRGGDRLWVRTPSGSRTALAVRQGDTVLVSYGGRQFVVEKSRRTAHRRGTAGSGTIAAPMPGLIVDVPVTAGQSVARGDRLVVLEAMKTQQAFPSPVDGVVSRVDVAPGDQVSEGQVLIVVDAAPDP